MSSMNSWRRAKRLELLKRQKKENALDKIRLLYVTSSVNWCSGPPAELRELAIRRVIEELEIELAKDDADE